MDLKIYPDPTHELQRETAPVLTSDNKSKSVLVLAH